MYELIKSWPLDMNFDADLRYCIENSKWCRNRPKPMMLLSQKEQKYKYCQYFGNAIRYEPKTLQPEVGFDADFKNCQLNI